MLITTCQSCHNGFVAKNRNQSRCDDCQERERRRDRHKFRSHHPQFIGIDGEGIGDKYVLLGCGEEQIEWWDGVRDVKDIFEFLYSEFDKNPYAYFGGFYLGYDWNMWLKLMPLDRIEYLFDPRLIAKRTRRGSPIPFPIRYEGWEWDFLYGKRFKLRPEDKKSHWMYICDYGPFFQTSFLTALEKLAPGSEIDPKMLAKIREGKRKRASAKLDDNMREYNRLENLALSHLMDEVNHSLNVLGLPLGKTQYHGPGQAAQKWILKQPRVKEINAKVLELPKDQYDAFVASYYGGIFEIVAHGHVAGTSYEYDINSAYPYQIRNLPCLCGEWEWIPASKVRRDQLALLHLQFVGTDSWLGPLPFRTETRAIRRPLMGSGWYWNFEVNSAANAGLLTSVKVDQCLVYKGCGHAEPLSAIEHLYNERIRVGKETSIGKGCKLIYNSAYGKFAQSVGNPRASNAIYASLITAGCRRMILDAIGSHPYGTDALLMIATDAVFFSKPHPHLPLSNKLGEWDCAEKENLTLFKPGMYWDDKAREAIRKGQSPVFKSRGVNARDFAKKIGEVDRQFSEGFPGAWPQVTLSVGFAQISVKQAYQRTKLTFPREAREFLYSSLAGHVLTDVKVEQDSDPWQKRQRDGLTRATGNEWRSHPHEGSPFLESVPYDSHFGRPEDELTEMDNEDGPVADVIASALQLREN